VKSVVKKKELTVETLKEVILHYAEGKKYFSMEMLKKVLAAEKYDFAKQTLKQNLNHLTKEKTIFDAGRGWYSTLPETLKLDKSTLEPTVQNILEQFPLLPFNCWGTQQLNAFFHHMLGKFVIFIYSEKDYLPTLFDYLRSNGENVYLNPLKNEVDKNFNIDYQTLVLRPSITEESFVGHYATIEKILVDFYIESLKLHLTQLSEVRIVFNNITNQYRINMAAMLRYSQRRKVKSDIERTLNIPMSL